MTLESCPKCSHKLAPPLKSSGRQICMKCGWSDRPRGASGAKPPTKVQPREDISQMEIKKILAEATEKAKQNMKPRRLQETDEGPLTPDSARSPLEDLLRRDRSTD
ncbi:hypothetical protein [Leptolyngbya sp. FACHB-16]|uniref:hypothetical protein n=2 Tax=Leptolyngbya TaxID=47251 RepID=UPI001684A316|nr:hypothetical protein [Leptolyngbya sp. FACHB-16]MBD1909968.1 hypothetical protein [Leptolyngbya sp. FACHB-8]MBD2156041.1 hypothetical protein [Leptolyngbya sp. FACHB-16]